jgi:hydroxymethylpyrimidine pyrophosphatase-like HAD family hydrolase
MKGLFLSAQDSSTKNGLPFQLGAFDLDGTVLRRDLRITARTVAALDELRVRGMRLVVATGRRFEGAREHAERLGFADRDPLICYGGSMVRRMNGETLLHRTSEEPGVSVVDSPADWLRDGGVEPTKLVLVDHPDAVERWLEEARAAFAGRLFVTRSLPHYVEVGGLDGTKSKALKFLCENWRIDPARAIAFGDADNDVDMLRFVGHGVAVGGMTDEVRQAADAVAPPVDEDGVASYLEEMLGAL